MCHDKILKKIFCQHFVKGPNNDSINNIIMQITIYLCQINGSIKLLVICSVRDMINEGELSYCKVLLIFFNGK